MTTKYKIAEQVLLRLKGGRPDMATTVDIRDIMVAVGQEVNAMIGAQYYKTTLPSGETIPDGLVLATYENVSVTAWKTISRSLLPAMPVSLPRNVGIFAVSSPTNPHDVFIPAQAGQIAMVKSQRLISDFGGVVAYEPYGPYIEYDTNITIAPKNITNVMMRLVVKDAELLNETDPLPIPADYEAVIVQNLFERYMKQGEADKKSDVLIENK